MALQQGFTLGSEWYRGEGVRRYALGYYEVFREILRGDPESRSAIVRCRECGIFFFAHRSNWGRWDLLCPFGCSVHHRRQESNRRAKAYYQTPEGKLKKKALNERRWAEKGPTEKIPSSEPRIVPYLRFILSFIDKGVVTLEEALGVFQRVLEELRQQGLLTFFEESKVPDG